MLIFKDFHETSSIQATVFMPGFNFVTAKILKSLLDLGSSLFDGDPTVLPLPEDAPVDIPRVTLKNRDSSMRLEVAPLRINFFRIKINEDDRIATGEFISTAGDFLKKVLNNIGAGCGRMAAVINRFCYNDNPGLEIAKHFCKGPFMEKPFDRPNSFELHAHKKYPFLSSFEINSWVRIKSGRVKPKNGTPRAIVLAEQDINTLAELMDSKIYSEEEISKFFANVIGEFDKILKLYFPSN